LEYSTERGRDKGRGEREKKKGGKINHSLGFTWAENTPAVYLDSNFLNGGM